MLTDSSVDWRHCRVEPRDEGWMVVDLTGERRTEVNGMRVAELLLSPDDQIIVGGEVIRFEVHDFVEQAYDEAVLERLNTDELTGLLGPPQVRLELTSALMAAIQRREPLVVAVLDIDRLKPINDRHGHLVGARVIAEVGGIVGRVVGERGPACRLGGDEFGVVLPGHDGAMGEQVAGAVRAGSRRRASSTRARPFRFGSPAVWRSTPTTARPRSSCCGRPTKRSTGPSERAATASRSADHLATGRDSAYNGGPSMEVLYFIVLVGVLIFVHELGHFVWAKFFGVKVLKFSLGFGPRIAGFERGGTEYVIAALPLGGYVRMLGESPNDRIRPEDDGHAFWQQPLWKRMIIVFAGPAMNLVFPIALLFVVFLGHTQTAPAMIGHGLSRSTRRRRARSPATACSRWTTRR